eukprot:359839-Chlamydomonas_euryale.AAC.1
MARGATYWMLWTRMSGSQAGPATLHNHGLRLRPAQHCPSHRYLINGHLCPAAGCPSCVAGVSACAAQGRRAAPLQDRQGAGRSTPLQGCVQGST